ncbi:MAG: ribose 5-phosphate isomerase B [Nitrospirota bacterium]|jgi:ribose 5-phosphate isomerase B
MKIAIGCDHAAVEMKDAVAALLRASGVQVEDMGTRGKDSVDYPDFGERVARAVASGEADRGILICGTGIGMSIVANKVPAVRAALCNEPLSARMSRLHNDANVLVMGARLIGPAMAADIVRTWLETPFEGGRHALRLEKITRMEGKAGTHGP